MGGMQRSLQSCVTVTGAVPRRVVPTVTGSLSISRNPMFQLLLLGSLQLLPEATTTMHMPGLEVWGRIPARGRTARSF